MNWKLQEDKLRNERFLLDVIRRYTDFIPTFARLYKTSTVRIT